MLILETLSTHICDILKKKVFILASSDRKIGSCVDVDAYCNFLTSSIGGRWLENEIHVFQSDVDKIGVLGVLYNARDNHDYDYIIFIYTGHGGTRGTSVSGYTDVMCLENGEEIFECEVLGIADRQLTILDSCRVPIRDEPERVKAASARMYLTESRLDLSLARKCYEAQISLSPKSQYRMFACSVGEYASGSSRLGGLFSRRFMEVAKQRSRKACAYSPIALSDIFFETQSLFEKENLGQTPDAFFPRTETHCLPWALGSLWW